MKKLSRLLGNNLGFILLIVLLILYNHFCDTCIILTGSMEPVLMTGSIAVINTAQREPDIGDIAAYRTGSSTIIHRVTGITDDGYIFKGDNNPSEDPDKVRPDHVEGTMVFCINFVSPIIKRLLLKEPS